MQAWGQGKGSAHDCSSSMRGARIWGQWAVVTATLCRSRRRASHSLVSVAGGTPAGLGSLIWFVR